MKELSRFVLPALIVLLISVVIFVIISFIDYSRVGGLTLAQQAIKMGSEFLGILIALSALLALLQHVRQGRQSDNLITLGLCILGGVMLYDGSSGSAIAFGLVLVAHIVEQILAKRSKPTNDVEKL